MPPSEPPTRVIALSQPTFGEEEIEALRAVLASGWVAGQGPRGAELEARFGAWCDGGHAVAVANCTAALHLAMLGFDVGPGDEVLVADYTYPATGHAVRYTGATPVFVDVRPDTWTIDVDAAAAAVGDRTVGIVAVDTLGQCADYDPLRDLARARGLFLVEDAACSVGATYRGRPSGTLADVACFSLHARKGITSGEGGLLVTADAARADRARRLSCFGVESALAREQQGSLPVPVFEELGYNYKLSDIQAAVALVQLDRLPSLLAARRRIAAAYAELLGDLAEVTLPATGEDRDHTWQTYALTLDPSLASARNRVAAQLRARGVQANLGTFASHVQPVYGVRPPCPVSAGLFARHLAVPMHANLTDADVEYVAAAVRDVVQVAATGPASG
ncbi:MAG: pyridoxal phosphate-dependent aminotransferase [Acidimicrobiia bacterium]